MDVPLIPFNDAAPVKYVCVVRVNSVWSPVKEPRKHCLVSVSDAAAKELADGV